MASVHPGIESGNDFLHDRRQTIFWIKAEML